MNIAAKGPDRGWMPSFYVNPHNVRLSCVGEQELPEGFPMQITSGIAWSGRTPGFDSPSPLILLPTHIRELEEASGHFKGTSRA